MNAAEMSQKLAQARRIIAAMQAEQQAAYEGADPAHDYATRSYHHGLSLGLRSAIQILDAQFPEMNK